MFSVSKKTDKHVRATLAAVSKASGIPLADLEAEVDKKIAELEELRQKSPILYDTIADNVIEGEAFNFLKKHKVEVKGAQKFSPLTFYKLFRRIRVENDSLFPLRNFIDHKALEPRVILTPDSRTPQFNDIPTACATPAGEFVFNKEFMQQLLDYAHLKKITPKGKKYDTNGGDIPGDYAYIEFLIKHELYHYTYADFHYQKILKADPQIINWVGDFRSNYDLVKSGNEQIPIGLFSTHVNYDKQRTYREMYDLVKSEMDKLSPPMQDRVKQIMDGLSSDEHGEGGEGDPGEGDPSEGEGKGKPKDGKSSGREESKTEEDVEKNEEDARKRAGSGGKEIGSEKDAPEQEKKSNSGNARSGGRGAGSNGSESVDYTKFRPKKSWKEILKKLVTSAGEEIETTYQRPHRRNITNVHIASQSGAGAIKPAERVSYAKAIKLLIVEDSSGSMSQQIGQIHSEIAGLLKMHGNQIVEFAVIKFSGTHECYVCQLKNGVGTYHRVESYDGMKQVGESKPFTDLLNVHFGSSTNFDSKVTDDARALIRKGYNALIISDSDICGGENLGELKKLYTENKKQTFVMMADRGSFHSLISSLKEISANVTHF